MCNFRDPNLVTFYLCIYRPSIFNEEHFTFHLQYKHSGTFANRKYEELSYTKNQKVCDPILVTLLKMPPHESQTSRENATPSSGTCPLASYKEVPPYPPPRVWWSWRLESGIQLKESLNPTNDWNPDPSSTDKESWIQYLVSGIQGVESRITKSLLDSPNMGRVVSCRDKFIRFCNTSYIP